MQDTETLPYFAITHEWNPNTDRMEELAEPVIGPSHTQGHLTATERFRLLDDDRNIMAMGMANGESLNGEYNPLTCYGEAMFGCTMLQVRKNGRWEDYLG